jgi:hypothetical protein
MIGIGITIVMAEVSAPVASVLSEGNTLPPPPPVDPTDRYYLDGGDAFTTAYERTIDGGTATTTVFTIDYSGGTA